MSNMEVLHSNVTGLAAILVTKVHTTILGNVAPIPGQAAAGGDVWQATHSRVKRRWQSPGAAGALAVVDDDIHHLRPGWGRPGP